MYIKDCFFEDFYFDDDFLFYGLKEMFIWFANELFERSLLIYLYDFYKYDVNCRFYNRET